MRHVVFVDDDPSVLSGIRRLMHTMRTQAFIPARSTADIHEAVAHLDWA